MRQLHGQGMMQQQVQDGDVVGWGQQKPKKSVANAVRICSDAYLAGVVIMK